MCDCEWEDRLRSQGYILIAGVDEVGRGALAGPVYAAAVILRLQDIPDGIDDSKRLSRPKRERLAVEIRQRARAIGLARVEPDEIDRINIYQATLKAMREAIGTLLPTPDALLIDALTIPGIMQPQCALIRGDAKSVSIAAASIIAKVTRDEVMRQYATTYPEYGFERHVGYGTRFHWDALRQFGPTPIHRLTFRGVANPLAADNLPVEQDLFEAEEASGTA